MKGWITKVLDVTNDHAIKPLLWNKTVCIDEDALRHGKSVCLHIGDDYIPIVVVSYLEQQYSLYIKTDNANYYINKFIN
jgi:hypothetical protein